MTPELVFAFADRQNHFFIELAEALIDELTRRRVQSSIVTDCLPPPQKGRIVVLMPPHEYVELRGFEPPEDILARCVAISAEQPTSKYFANNLALASRFGAVFDINPRAIRSYNQAGVPAQLLALGYTHGWDTFDARDRDIDILFMGRVTERRARALASFADLFEPYRCHIQLFDNSRPAVAADPDFLTGAAKRALLARSKVLLSIHGEDEPYFEWLRMIEGICAGCLIVSEHSTDTAPLLPGTHLITGAIGRLGLLCGWGVDDTAARNRIRRAAYDLLVAQRPLARAASALVRAAERLDELPISVNRNSQIDFLSAQRRASVNRQLKASTPVGTNEEAIRWALKSQGLETQGLKRRLERIELQLASHEPVDLAPRIVL